MAYTEDLLHFLWKFRLFRPIDLKTTSGHPVEILSTGIHNKHAGPDFEQAKIRIGETLWAGNVEMHLRSSDWLLHKHSDDKAYDNVVLHVVLDHDKDVFRSDGTVIPVLTLRERIPEHIFYRYRDLMENLSWIPCQNKLSSVGDLHLKAWLSRVLVERLEEKSVLVSRVLDEYKGSWDDAFYILLARNFGFKTNGDPFELLARSLPQTVLARHKDNSTHIEALLFGQAGLLSEKPADNYQLILKREYAFFKKKYSLTALEPHLWKFFRLRPNNFPTIRLAQFAALVLKSNHLFSKIIELDRMEELRSLFSGLPVNSYWNTHYRFGVTSKPESHQLGESSIDNILLNTIALFIFAYGKHLGRDEFVSRAIALLESLPFETNQITRCFSGIGVKKGGADVSQGLLQLKKAYCDRKKCLDCGIGVKILKQE